MKVSPTVYHRVRDWLAEDRSVYHVSCTDLRCLREAWVVNRQAVCPVCQSPLDWKNATHYDSLDSLEVAPTSPTHVTGDQLTISYDEPSSALLVVAPSMTRPAVFPMFPDEDPEWLDNVFQEVASGQWAKVNYLDIMLMLGFHNIYLLPPSYEDYTRQVLTPEGVWVEVTTRLYPDNTLHEMTTDRAIHLNVAAKAHFALSHRTHIAEVKTQLGEHQFALAYLLVDHLCDKLELGRLKLETQPFLNLENLTPDDIENQLTRVP